MRLLIFFIFFFSKTYSQKVSSKFEEKLCSYETLGSVQSKLIKLKMAFPCKWEQANNPIPNGVVKFSIEVNKIRATSSLVIGDITNDVSDAYAKSFITPEGLKILTHGAGTIVSNRFFKINGIPGGEVILKPAKDRGYCFYEIQNYFIYKRKIILIDYSYASSWAEASNSYTKYLELFRNLISKTIFQ